MLNLVERLDAVRDKVETIRFLTDDNFVCLSFYCRSVSLQVDPSVMVRLCSHFNDLVPDIVPDSDGLHVRGNVDGLELVCVCDTPQQAIDIVEAMKVFK